MIFMYKFLFFLFFLVLKCNYFVTYLENPQKFSLLKNNIGFIHKYFKQAITIVVVDNTNNSFSDIVDQISFWKQVHIIDKKNIFLYFKDYLPKSFPAKTKIGVIEYIFDNFLVSEKTKVIFFDIYVSLFKSKDILLRIFSNNEISYSENHILISLQALKNDLKWIINRIKMNKFGSQDIEFLEQFRSDLKMKKDEVRNNTLSCRINFKDLHYSVLYTENVEKPYTDKKRVAILLPTLNSNINLNENPLFKHTLPSLSKTISSGEFKEYIITIFIAYDIDDIFFKMENSIERHKQMIKTIFGSSVPLKIKYTKFPVSKSVVFLWNSLFVEAYKDKNDYFVQLNDDTEIDSTGWLSKSINYFEKGFDGVIGFNSQEWGCKLFTQTLVSRKHFERNNGNFYPMLFHNSMSDIWITEYYKNKRICLREYRTNNHFSKTRYKKCPFNRRLLKKILKKFETKY